MFFRRIPKVTVALLFILLAACVTAEGQAPSTATPNSAGKELNNGVEAYKAARYDEAIAHFRKAVEMDPGLPMAKPYLATALAETVIPGLDTPDNLKIADESIATFQQVLAANPHDLNSMKQVAGIYFSVKKLDDARTWQKKILDEDPQDSEAAYTIGVIDWQQAHHNALVALQEAGLNDDGEGNSLAPAQVMETIKAQNADLVEEAFHYLGLAVQLRPNYDDAMAYINLVYRRKADFDHGDEEARKQDVATAQEWAQKAMTTRRANEEKRAAALVPQPQ